MELYTLNQNFQRIDVIDEYESAIWTERYTDAGDVTLVVPPTQKMIQKLAEGTFLALAGSDEVMILETQLIEKGKLTVKGTDLLKFLDNRVIRRSPDHSIKSWIVINNHPLFIMESIVSLSCIETFSGTPDVGLDEVKEAIPNLTIAPNDLVIANTGPDISVEYGPVFSALKQLSTTYSIGMRLFLAWVTDTDYSIQFSAYEGRNLTSNQGIYPVVQFSPGMDTLMDLSSLRSMANYKNVAYAYASADPGGLAASVPYGVAYAYPAAASEVGFKRRTLMIFCDDITTDSAPGLTAAQLTSILNERAKDALANNNYTRVVDGEIIPQSGYEYGVDYMLGDIIELKSFDEATLQKARITEFIRVDDPTGERAYPTVSVLE